MSEGLKPGAPVRHPKVGEWHWQPYVDARVRQKEDMAANRAALPKPPWYAGERQNQHSLLRRLIKMKVSCSTCHGGMWPPLTRHCEMMLDEDERLREQYFCSEWGPK